MFEVHNNGRNTHRTLSIRGFYGFENVCSIHSSVKYSTNWPAYVLFSRLPNLRTSICPLNDSMFQIIVPSNNWIPI